MFLIGLGALLFLGGVLYMIRTAILRGPLSGRGSSRPIRDTLEPPTRSMRFLGVSANWSGHSPDGNWCSYVAVGGQFLTSVTRGLPL